MAFEKITSKIQWNKKLLPIKGHYFFFNAGTAPLVPYLSTYARQLGFSSATVGLIYTILPIFGLIAKPLFGVIADKFKIQKSLFIFFQIVTIASFSSIYFIPAGEQPMMTVDLAFDESQSLTRLKSCYNNNTIDLCKVTTLKNQDQIAFCKMKCDMSSPQKWANVCETWHIPEYCSTSNIEFTSYVNNVLTKDNCGYISASNITIDGQTYTPGCRAGANVDMDVSCKMQCDNVHLTQTLADEYVSLTCVDDVLNYRTCSNITQIKMPTDDFFGSCKIKCDEIEPWTLIEIYKRWVKTDSHPLQVKIGRLLHNNLTFIGAVPLSSAQLEHNCIYQRLEYIKTPDGQVLYPNRVSNTSQAEAETFQTSCEINCDNELVNDIFMGAMDSGGEETSQYTQQFWLFFMAMIISWIGQAVVVTFADAICFNLLGTKVSLYGKQRLWGSMGWGMFSLLTGVLIDVFSSGAVKNYTVAFVLMFVFMTGDVVVSSFLRIKSTKMSMSILADVGTLLSSLPTFLFLLWTIAVGLCTGLLWQFLFWLIEDVSKLTCEGYDYVKTLQGLVSAIQTFCGEIPFLFVSGYLLRKVGHVHMMSLVLFAFGVRFILYSLLKNPWWVLPIEMLQGITFGMFYPTMTSYANIVSPPGTETTVQGLVGAVFEGVGVSLGSFIGGRLYETYGGWNTFRWFGYGALACGFIHVIAQYALGNKNTPAIVAQDYDHGDAHKLNNEKIGEDIVDT